MVIRFLRENEINCLKEFTYQALYVMEGENPFDRAILENPEISKYYEGFDFEKELCFVATDGDKIVGAVWGRFLPPDRKGYGYYRPDYMELTISILPEYRNMGIGKELLYFFIKESNERKISGLSLSVSYGNYAKKLYEAFGFSVIENRKTDILMVLDFVF